MQHFEFAGCQRDDQRHWIESRRLRASADSWILTITWKCRQDVTTPAPQSGLD